VTALETLLTRFKKADTHIAIIHKNTSYSYQWLNDNIEHWYQWLINNHIKEGDIISLETYFNPTSIALLFALIKQNCIITPLQTSVYANIDIFVNITQIQKRIIQQTEKTFKILKTTRNETPPILYKQLRKQNHAGLVLLSSGTTGTPKAIVHDMETLLTPYLKILKKPHIRAALFLLFDHIGGLNTLFHLLGCGGSVVALQKRNPEYILQECDTHDINTLPTTPSFLRAVVASEAYNRYPLPKLQLITYGTEPMDAGTLIRLNRCYPHCRLKQTYGLTEIGILRSQSESSQTTWVKLGGNGIKTRIVNNQLEIKSKTSMLGYLNAPNPFTKDGWFMTKDSVEVKDNFIRILGRESNLINVGGQKVYPIEIESVIQTHPEVQDVLVHKETNNLLGEIVCATIQRSPLTASQKKIWITALKTYCLARLPSHKVPRRIRLTQSPLHNARFKKTPPPLGNKEDDYVIS